MNADDPQNEPGLGQTLRSDFRQKGFWKTMKREYREIKDFYIDEEKKSRLGRMNWIQRWVYFIGWLLKSMFLKLTPTRRILLLFGVIFILSSGTVTQKGGQVQVTDREILGGVLLLFVIMLELKDKILARDELEAGRSVQHALMSDQSPEVPGWSLWLLTRPANEVSGDLVDFLRLDDRRAAVSLADVTGKGLKAALLMAKLQATLRALAQDFDSIGGLVSKINDVFHRDSLPSIFASLLYAEIDRESGRIRFVNAGHLPPVIVSGGSLKEMPKGEPALGLLPHTIYSEQTVELQPGDFFFGYSDGLTEARDERGNFFGTERLFSLLSSSHNLSASSIGERITREVEKFTGEAPIHDDLSLVILKRA